MIVFAFVLFAFVLWLHSSVVVINTSVTLRPETGQRPPGNLWGKNVYRLGNTNLLFLMWLPSNCQLAFRPV